MSDAPRLPDFPTDPMTLDMVEASLDYCLTVDEETGEHVPVDPDVASLGDLCSFLSGTTTDPLGLIEHHGVVDTIFGPAEMTVDPRPTYTERDIIRSLINEVRRLRDVDFTPKDESRMAAEYERACGFDRPLSERAQEVRDAAARCAPRCHACGEEAIPFETCPCKEQS